MLPWITFKPLQTWVTFGIQILKGEKNKRLQFAAWYLVVQIEHPKSKLTTELLCFVAV